MRILVVEDEPILARQLKRSLEQEGYAIDLAHGYRAARDLEIETEYDLILLSLTLPDGCGLALLRVWRDEGLTTPVLILSARAEPSQRVAGLDAGADDYLVKPFAWEELRARVRCLLRRRHRQPIERLTCDDLILDRTCRRVVRAGTPIDVTTKEFSILEYLMLNRGHTISRTVIAEHVWDGAYEARSNTIDVLIARIRRKLEVGGRRRLIFTVRGLGYALRLQDSRSRPVGTRDKGHSRSKTTPGSRRPTGDRPRSSGDRTRLRGESPGSTRPPAAARESGSWPRL